MSLLFRMSSCLLVLIVICLINYLSCDVARSRRRHGRNHRSGSKPSKPKFKEILTLLRKRIRPKYHGAVLDWNLTDQLSAPRYMLNLYNKLKQDNDSPGFNVANITTTKSLGGADTIMGILNDVDDNAPNTSNFYMKFKFNFTVKMKKNESVGAAEFHIYKDLFHYSWMRNRSFLVELFIITIPGNPSKLRKELTTRVIKGWEIGWQIFDVTSTVNMWAVSPRNNYGLELTVKTINDVFPIQIDPVKLGFVSFKGPYQQRPFIVSFFNGDPTERSVIVHATERKRRSASMFEPKNKRYGKRGGNRGGNKDCRLRQLYVDFSDLDWQRYIIAPDGYQSSYCDGECTFAMVTPKNTTNHAIIQSLVHLHNPYSAPSPCCAPTQLNAISVLYYDVNHNLVLRKFKDMVVKACGCH